MLKYCVEQWDKNKSLLEERLREDKELLDCDYLHLLKVTVGAILNNGCDYSTWDIEKITEIDNGNYQGTLLFLIPKDTYQPQEYEYLMTYVGYGSCSGCDTLLAIQSLWEYIDDPETGISYRAPTERVIKDYMSLCKDMICNMVKPYNGGWRHDERFEECDS